MRLWIGAILVLLLLTVVLTAPATPVKAQQEVRIAPGGNYTIYVKAKKPTYMSLSGDWEIRFYLYSGTNCYNRAPSGTDGGWWQPSGSTTWLYTGYWDYRVRNQTWTSDEMTWFSTIKVIDSDNTNDWSQYEMRYPQAIGDGYENKMNEIPVGETITLKARFLFRDLSPPTFDGEYATFKIGTNTYRYKYTKSYDDYDLDEIGGTLSISEGTGEWRLSFDQIIPVIVDNTVSSTGTITITGTIDFSGLTPAGLSIPIELILAGGIILVVAIAAIFLVRRRRGEELPPVPEFAPPPPPEAPPAPPEAPPAPPEAPPETPPGEQPPAWALVSTP